MMLRLHPITRVTVLLVLGSLVAYASCTTDALLNLSSPTDGFIAPNGSVAPRVISVGFINSTPFRAIFTFGAYNQLDSTTIPSGSQQLRLEAGISSAPISQPCRKTFSVGGAELIRLINFNKNSPQITITDPQALIVGVNFSSAPVGDPLEAAPTEGMAVGDVRLAGVDFTCSRDSIQAVTGTGLLLFTFTQDAAAPGGFKIVYQFVPNGPP